MRAKVQSIIIVIIFLLTKCESGLISKKYATSNDYSHDNENILKLHRGSIPEDGLKTNNGVTLSRKERSVDSITSLPRYILKLLNELRKVDDVLTVEEEEATTETVTTQRETTLQYTTEIVTTEDLTTEVFTITDNIPQETTVVEDQKLETNTNEKLSSESLTTTEESVSHELPEETVTVESTTEDLAVGISSTDDPLPKETVTVESTTEDKKVVTSITESVESTTENLILATNSNEELITTEIFKRTETAKPLTTIFSENEETSTWSLLEVTMNEETASRENPTTISIFTETERVETSEVVTKKQIDDTTSVSILTTEEDLGEDIFLSTSQEVLATQQPVTILPNEETELGSDNESTTTLTTSMTSSEDANEESSGTNVDGDTLNIVVSILQYLQRISHQLLDGIQANNYAKIEQFLLENPWLIPSESKRRKRNNLDTSQESSCSTGDFACPDEGNFRVNQSCTKYYECRFNQSCKKLIPKIRKCPKCFKFNADKSICDLPENVPECTHSSVQKFYCTGQGQYFVPDDCHKYYDCQKNTNGTIELIVNECPPGTVFRAIEGKCVQGGKCNSRRAKCASGKFYSPDKFSCSMFHYCLSGDRTISMLCPTGFVFEDLFCEKWEESQLKKRLSKIQKT